MPPRTTLPPDGLPSALRRGWTRGLSRLATQGSSFRQDPWRATVRMAVLALSLVLHPWRNAARILSMRSASPLGSRLEALGESFAYLIVAPLIVPYLALLRLWLEEAEEEAEAVRRERIRERGATAPAGRSPAGTATNQAIRGTSRGTLPAEVALSRGTLLEVWQNPTDGIDLALHRACELIRREARYEVRLQTYLFDPESAPGRDLIATLAMKQAQYPDFRVMAVIDRPGLDHALAMHGVRAEVAVARPWWSRRGHHSKVFLIDGRTAILGGDNIDSPREKDLMVTLQGPVVQAMLRDFEDAWEQAAGPRARHPLPAAPAAPPLDGASAMTLLTKRGVTGFWGEDYQDNDSDQALLAALRSAREEVLIETPCLNADTVLRALVEIARRGVRVRICLPLTQHNRLATRVDAADNRSFVAFWTQLPDPIRERLLLRDFSSDGQTPEENHTKFVCIDRQWAYVGSQNLDNQSFAYSRELGVGIDDAAVASRLADEVFERDWATSLPIEPRWAERWIPYALWYH